MASRQTAERLKASQVPTSAEDPFQTSKKPRLDASSTSGTPSFYLTAQQIQLMNSFQSNQSALNPQQKLYLKQLQTQYHQMTLHQKQQQLAIQGAPGAADSKQQPATASTEKASSAAAESADRELESRLTQIPRLTSNSIPSHLLQSKLEAGSKASQGAAACLSDGDMRALLTPDQSVAALAEGLIAEFGLANGLTAQLHSHFRGASQPNSSHITANASASLAAFAANQVGSSTQRHITGEGASSQPQPRLSIDMPAEKILEACKGLGCHGRLDSSVLSDDCKPPSPPEPPYPPFPKDKLLPPTPSVFVSLLSFRLSRF